VKPHLQLRPYRLPLRRPWQSARGQFSARCGWLVVARCDGVSGYGDCAPLPEAGTETAVSAKHRLRHWCRSADRLDSDRLDDNSALRMLLERLADALPSETPAADCAVETALLDLQSRIVGLPLRHLLSVDAKASIAVNKVLGSAAALSRQQVSTALAQGWRVLKVKVGTAEPEQELRRLGEVAEILPDDALLRLDANGAWDWPTAAAYIDGLHGMPVDCIEEPLAGAQDAELARLQASTPFALALDESLAKRPWPIDAARLPVRRLVLKPAAIGGLRPTLRLARAAMASGREVILTSVVESAAGLWATAQLAAASGSPLAHGLATADWLAHDLGPAPLARRGRLALPQIAGSGFVPADAADS
jgi:o-succinylbenzoate synthase